MPKGAGNGVLHAPSFWQGAARGKKSREMAEKRAKTIMTVYVFSKEGQI